MLGGGLQCPEGFCDAGIPSPDSPPIGTCSMLQEVWPLDLLLFLGFNWPNGAGATAERGHCVWSEGGS